MKIVLDCNDAERLAAFWSEALGYRRLGGAGQYVLLAPPGGGEGSRLLLQGVPEPKSGKNRMHIDLHAPDIEAEATRLEGIGAKRLAGPVEEFTVRWIVMADPEGNEFCVCDIP